MQRNIEKCDANVWSTKLMASLRALQRKKKKTWIVLKKLRVNSIWMEIEPRSSERSRHIFRMPEKDKTPKSSSDGWQDYVKQTRGTKNIDVLPDIGLNCGASGQSFTQTAKLKNHEKRCKENTNQTRIFRKQKSDTNSKECSKFQSWSLHFRSYQEMLGGPIHGEYPKQTRSGERLMKSDCSGNRNASLSSSTS